MTTTKITLDELSISEKRLDELASRPDSAIDYSDVPELDDDFWKTAKMHIPANKERLTVRFDTDIVQWFKEQGKGYQTRMNTVLRSYYEAHKNTP